MDFNDKIARIDKNYSDKIKISLSILFLFWIAGVL